MSIMFRFPIEIIKLFLMQRLMGYSVTKKPILPCCTASASFAMLWYLSEKLDDNTAVIVCALLVIINISLFINGRNKILSVILGVVTLWFVDIFFGNILTMLFSDSIEPFVDCVSLIVLIVLFFAFRILNIPHIFKFEAFDKKQALIYIFGLFSFALYLAPYQIAEFESNTLRANRFLAILSAISGIFLIVISINAAQKQQYREIAKITETMRKNQEQYFQLLLNKEEETKKFRHDLSNHLYSIKYLLENEKIDSLKNYLDDINLISAKLKPEIQTGSDIINAIICQLRESYKDVNYEIEWNGYFQNNVKIAPIDLSSIFYNLLANSIEAVDKVPGQEQKVSNVTVKQSNNLLYFCIKNPCAMRAIKSGIGFATSKKVKTLHGLGSKNIALSVEKYGGEVKYNINDNEFEAEVFFYDS